jgi:hypothetical protein
MMKRRLRLAILSAASLLLGPATLPAPKNSAAFPREFATEVKTSNGFAIWDVTWKKGKSTGMRELALDQVTVTLTEGAVKVSRSDGSWDIQQRRFGSVSFQSKGTIVEEEGVSDAPSRAIVFQIQDVAPTKWPTTEGVPGMFPRVGAVELFETDRIRIWDSAWKPGERIERHLHYIETAAVFLDGGVIRTIENGASNRPSARKSGDVIVSPPIKVPHEEEQVEGTPRAIWVEFK